MWYWRSELTDSVPELLQQNFGFTPLNGQDSQLTVWLSNIDMLNFIYLSIL